jgi:hypothetical protein
MPPNRDESQRLKRWLDLAEKLGDADAHGFQRVREPLTALEGYRNGGLKAHFHVGIRSGLFPENPRYLCARLRAGNGHGRLPEGTARFHATNREIPDVNHLRTEFSVCDGGDRLKRGNLKLSVLVPLTSLVSTAKGWTSLDAPHS